MINEKTGEEAQYILNAGLVLLHPFLPRLFDMLSLMEDGKFTGEEARLRAMLLMQYAVFGSTEYPEHGMRLNKLLAGVGEGATQSNTLVLTDHEKATVDGMLGAVIKAWAKLGNASVDALRKTFLIRDGKLEEQDDFYQLFVEERAFDMLLASLPWSISTIKFNWMEKEISVRWM